MHTQRHETRDSGWFEGGWLILASALAALFALLCGCNNDLPTASRLERARVLGARVRVAADPARADALPGEAAAVEWLVAGPRAADAANVAWAFAVCISIEGACVAAPAMPAKGTGAPVLAPFTAPATIDQVSQPLMVGALCGGGAVVPDPATGGSTCAAATESATVARFAIPMAASVGTANHHPNFGNDALEFDGTPWTATSTHDAGAPCDATSGLPLVEAGTAERHLRIVTDADDRETWVRTAGAAPELEELQVSSFATGGELGGSYADIPAADTRPDADAVVRWTPPPVTDVPAAGVVVLFQFVMRDGRGGLDSLSRALCVTAP